MPHSATVHRIPSADGTAIAYWTCGDGPPLLLVHGMCSDHERFQSLLPHLMPHFTVHAMDRRGRGGSGDGDGYAPSREFEDVAAVADAIAAAAGAPVDVYGHSFGGFCAFGAAALTENVGRLVLYEGWPAPDPARLAFPPGAEAQLDAFVAEGEREAALVHFLERVVQMSPAEIEALRTQAAWPARVAAVHAVTREARSEQAVPFDPAQAARIRAPVLLVTGEHSPEFLKADVEAVASAFPDAHIAVLEGQQHVGDVLAPDRFAELLTTFLRPSG
jgi:pimeloyl-ACP methyl ester carboxylesterase